MSMKLLTAVLLKSKKIRPLLHVLSVIVAFLIINLLADRFLNSLRVDMTSERLFTVSNGSKTILSRLDEPIKISFYFSEALASGIPSIQNYATRIEGLIQALVYHSNGNLQFEKIALDPFSEAEDEALAYGLTAVPIDQNGSKFYFGAVIRDSVDHVKTIPFFSFEREAFIEYDLMRQINELSQEKKPVLAIYSSLPLANEDELDSNWNNPKEGWQVMAHLKDFFDIVYLPDNVEEIDANTDILMVIPPFDIDEQSLLAIDQYVLSGGHGIFFVDPLGEFYKNDSSKNNEQLTSLFKAWGIEYRKDLILADGKYARIVEPRGRDGSNVALHYLPWLSLSKEAINSTHMITSQLDSIAMSSAGVLTLDPESNMTFTPLLESSNQSMLIPKKEIENSANPASLIRSYQSDAQSYVLATLINGKVESPFKEKIADDSTKLRQSKGDIHVMVVADTDMLHEKNWLRTQRLFGQVIHVPIADNAAFLINALDYLSGDDALISVRSRRGMSRPFHRVDALKKKAEIRYLQKEQELQTRLRETEAALMSLQQSDGEQASLLLSNEQSQALEQFENEYIRIRKELRFVQRELNKDIALLGTILKFINIFLVPIIITVIAVVLLRRRYHRNNLLLDKRSV